MVNEIVVDLVSIKTSSNESMQKAQMENALFLCGFALTKENTSNWNGFVEMSTREKRDYEVSKVLIQPFLDLLAASLNAIYPVLMYASTKSRKTGMKTCFVTFD